MTLMSFARGAGVAAVVGVAAGLAAPAAVHANMTIAVVGAGGLEPTKTNDIAIEREDLFVSPDRIRVHYVFRNSTATTIVAPILFPLPPIDAYLQVNDTYTTSIVNRESGPAVDVSVRVGGAPVEVRARQRAYGRDGTDITARLVHHRIDMLGIDERTARDMPPAEMAALLNDGILMKFDPDPGFYPNWVVRGEYLWTQEFGANAATEVVIEYAPLTGGFEFHSGKLSKTEKPAVLEGMLSFGDGKAERALWSEHYCFTRGTVGALSALLTTDESSIIVHWTRYILMTALNWNGPIGTFHLTVDKQDPQAVAAFCSPDRKVPIRQTGPTTYELTIKDFRPQDNFSLMVLDHPTQ